MLINSNRHDVLFSRELSSLLVSRKAGPSDGDNTLCYPLDPLQEQAIAAAVTQYASDHSAVIEFRQRMTSIISSCPGLGRRYQQARLKEGLPPLPLRECGRQPVDGRADQWADDPTGQGDEPPM